MLLLRWLFDNYVPWSFYDLEDDPQEQSDEDWVGLNLEDSLEGIQVVFLDDDPREETDEDLVYFYFEDDQVGTVYPDEDIREETDEDWVYFYFEDDIQSTLYPDEDIREEFEDDWTFAYGQTDVTVVVTDNEQWLQYVLDDDPREEYDEEWIYRLDDQVYDIDQIFTIIDHEERIDDEDDWFSAYGQTDIPPTDVSEQIWFVSEQDEYYLEDVEDSLIWDPYGNVDAPLPPPPPPPPTVRIPSGPTSNTYIVRDRWGTGWTASRYRRGYSNG